MDLPAAAKMKATATVTLFLTFLIAVGCSSAELNWESRVGEQQRELEQLGELKRELEQLGELKLGVAKLGELGAVKVDVIEVVLGDNKISDPMTATMLRSCYELSGMSARGTINNVDFNFGVSDLDFVDNLTIIGKVRKVSDVSDDAKFRRTIDIGHRIIGTIGIDDRNDFSIIMNKDDFEKFGEFGEYVVIQAHVSRGLRSPGFNTIFTTNVYHVAHQEEEAMTMKALTGEATGSSWIRAGIFSLTVLLAAAVALIFWNLQKKTKARNEKTLYSKKMK